MQQEGLRSGQTLWRAIGSPPLECAPLQDDVTCEVAIVGGGITGALVAYRMVEAGVDAVIVDREDLGAGSTAASTGLLQYEIDTPLVELIQLVGEQNAVHAYRRGVAAIDELEVIVANLPQSSQFTRRPALYLASNQQDSHDLQAEYECRRHFGFDVQFWKSDQLQSLTGLIAPSAIWSLGDGEIDPYLFTQNVMKEAVQKGVRSYSHTKILSLEEKSNSVELRTKHGRITARHAIFATGYSQEFLSHEVGTLRSTYALASEPLEDVHSWPERCLIWETARPYFYARTTLDGRAIIGGEDTTDADDHEDHQLMYRKAAALSQRFARLFPNLAFTPYCIWAGTFAETKDGLPYIGAPPGRERIYFALGYGGNGITFSTIAARMLTDHILGHSNPDAAVFRFGR